MPGTVLPLASARAASSAPQRVIVSPPRFRASAKIGTVASRVAFRRGLKNAGGEKQGLKKGGGFIERRVSGRWCAMLTVLLSCSDKRKNHGHGRTPTTPQRGDGAQPWSGVRDVRIVCGKRFEIGSLYKNVAAIAMIFWEFTYKMYEYRVKNENVSV